MPSNNNKCNILLVANWESDVGYAWWLMENFWVTISDHFQATGKDSFLIYPKITTIPDTVASANIKTAELSFTDHSIGNLFKIYKFIRTNSIRSLYLSDAPSYSWFYLLLRIFGIRKIAIHDHTPGDRTPPSFWLKTVKKLIQSIPFFTADHFIAVSDFVYRRHLEVDCMPEKKCSTATNGIHPYDLTQVDSHYAQKNFDIPEDRLIIVTTGRASTYKGIDFYIRCADQLINKQKLDQLHFLFCGDGPEMQDFQALCSSFNLDAHFTFAGKRKDIKEILPACHIGFHCSKGEVGYSLSTLEYMSAGLATIVPDLPSTSNATRHGDTGMVYHHDDINSACTAITQCLPDEFRKNLTDNAIQDIKLNYDIRMTNKMLISNLDKCL